MWRTLQIPGYFCRFKTQNKTRFAFWGPTYGLTPQNALLLPSAKTGAVPLIPPRAFGAPLRETDIRRLIGPIIPDAGHIIVAPVRIERMPHWPGPMVSHGSRHSPLAFSTRRPAAPILGTSP